MIADFDYSHGEHSEAVMVRLCWGADGERYGRILVPTSLGEMLEAGGYPPIPTPWPSKRPCLMASSSP